MEVAALLILSIVYALNRSFVRMKSITRDFLRILKLFVKLLPTWQSMKEAG